VRTTDWDTLVTRAFCNPIEKSNAADRGMKNAVFLDAEKLTAIKITISMNIGIT
jgi:hypothetical protein